MTETLQLPTVGLNNWEEGESLTVRSNSPDPLKVVGSRRFWSRKPDVEEIEPCGFMVIKRTAERQIAQEITF